MSDVRWVVRASEAVSAILKQRFPNLTVQETVQITGRIVEVVIETAIEMKAGQ